jgi:hypothetical protein
MTRCPHLASEIAKAVLNAIVVLNDQLNRVHLNLKILQFLS